MPTANAITRTVSLQINNPPLSDSMRESCQLSQIVAAEEAGEFSAGTGSTGTNIPYGAITSGQEGGLMIWNADPTNYADLGVIVSGTFYPVARLYPTPAGQSSVQAQLIDVSPSVQLVVKANTAACLIKYLMNQL